MLFLFLLRIESRHYIDDLLDILERFSKKLKHSDGVSNNVAKLLASIPPKTLKILENSAIEEHQTVVDKNNNALVEYDDCHSINSSNSSENEANKEFMTDFMS